MVSQGGVEWEDGKGPGAESYTNYITSTVTCQGRFQLFAAKNGRTSGPDQSPWTLASAQICNRHTCCVVSTRTGCCFLSRGIHVIMLPTMPIEQPAAREDCVFCKIVRGTAPASTVYADDLVMAFMDIQPVNEGHILIVPRVHAASLDELAVETGAQLFRVAMELSMAIRQSGVRCEGVNLSLADGEAAGQEVFHVHLHLIPRFRGDGFGLRFPADYQMLPERGRLDEVAADIRQALEVSSSAL